MDQPAYSENRLNLLRDSSFVLIFVYAPAGLGHLRVTNALYRGLPEGIHPLLLGAEDHTLTYLHRITSINTLGRRIMELLQQGTGESIFSHTYRRLLLANSDLIYKQMLTLLDQRFQTPRKVLIIATHFALAHQIGFIKDRIEKARNVKVGLVVQVTDDSPQRLWYVKEADLTFVPSYKTKQRLLDYATNKNLNKIDIEVIPYPLSPLFSKFYDTHEFNLRINQLNLKKAKSINLIVPISGAAVGLNYISLMLSNLYKNCDKFIFHIVSKDVPFTKQFLKIMSRKKYANLLVSQKDKEVVELYEKSYIENVIALEITKPSEQSFKALLAPNQVGGSLLLFSTPIGRQEYDNLDFLTRHNFIPNENESSILFDLAKSDSKITKIENPALYSKTKHFRGLRLPQDPIFSSNFILWGLKSELFKTIISNKKRSFPKEELKKNELGTDGVAQFWNKVIDKFYFN